MPSLGFQFVALFRPAALALILAISSGACSGETPVPIDLTDTVPPSSITTAPAEPDLGGSDGASNPESDPNRAEKERMVDLAEQQCRDDPELEEGVVKLVDPATDQEVSEVVVQCSEISSDG